ncbi:MAG: hypothetical protein D6802_05535 [Ardenticatenia bacterium]|nr:MAG: hypothetical protein D6802_05535 [Ardenticatenia bacterium]
MNTYARILESLLYADIDNLRTVAALIDQVAGHYRFVANGIAATTIAPPSPNLINGLNFAVREIEETTGRHILAQGVGSSLAVITPENAEGQGVDMFLATVSLVKPMNVAIFAFDEEIDLPIAMVAAGSLPTRVTFRLVAAPKTLSWGGDLLNAIATLSQTPPDVILVSAASLQEIPSSLEELGQSIALLQDMLEPRDRALVIVIGAKAVQDTLYPLLHKNSTLEAVLLEDQPDEYAVAEETLQLLETYYQETRIARLPGFGAIQSWSNFTIRSALAMRTLSIRQLSRQTPGSILYAHIGSEATQVIAADQHSYRSFVDVDWGTGYSMAKLLQQDETLEQVLRWTPGMTPERDLLALLWQRSLRPHIRPTIEDLLWLEHAAARVVLNKTIRALPSTYRHETGFPAPTFLIGSGPAIQMAPRPAQAAMILVDAVQPVGVVRLMRERLGLLPLVGYLAEEEQTLIADLLRFDMFESLGTLIVPFGEMNPGKPVLEFTMPMPGGGSYTVEVEAGQLYREYVPPGTQFSLELKPARGIDIGEGSGRKRTITIHGGAVGLIVDARGRPLPQTETLVTQRKLVQDWMLYVGS